MKYLNLNIDEYINYIQENPIEVDLFLDKFTINYTYFFRNLNVFENFEKFIKIYVKNHKKNILKIWSAPCATGEEPYSIAMLLEKVKKETKNFPDYVVVASDIDKNALKIARAGVYGDYSIHELPNYYYISYFKKKNTPLGPKYSVAEEIKKKVAFVEEDIIRGHRKNIKYDVIFCRNFFIYMNKPSQEKLLRMLERQLIEGGILILGKTEMIMKTN
ncbi:MAG: protein-glutamate O-methyltransferase CheR, partial [Candidatus Lokiarchaeota archaeon]|nr:protein-glutamate O-methyltransferase CheR [Candidatus Lokiarchaeota archaeon]